MPGCFCNVLHVGKEESGGKDSSMLVGMMAPGNAACFLCAVCVYLLSPAMASFCREISIDLKYERNLQSEL